MRYSAYFLRYLSRGVSPEMAWQLAPIAIVQEQPQPVNQVMNSQEWNPWPYTGQPQDPPQRHSRWPILTRRPGQSSDL